MTRVIRTIWIISVLSLAVGCDSSGIKANLGASAAGQPDLVYTGGVVAADHPVASAAGLEMLELGGNAVDAAVATSFCLAVVRPESCGLGGGGFMMIHTAPETDEAGRIRQPSFDLILDYRETAPSAVGPDYYVNLGLEHASRYGQHAAGVPGTVAGLLYALEHFGTLDRDLVLAPAIRAAEDGIALDDNYVQSAQNILDQFHETPGLIDRIGIERYEWLHDHYLRGGQPRVGDVMRQPALARTLRKIATQGASGFYIGDVAESIVEACPQMTLEDLGGYEVRLLRPLRGSFRGRTFLTMPPPSSGGLAILQTVGMLERLGSHLEGVALNDETYAQVLVECLKHAFADRAEWLGDTDFVHVPLERLSSASYIDDLASRVDLDRTHEPPHYGSRRVLSDDSGTSHLSVIDAKGNAVACTETVNLEFGSLYAVPEHGFMLNNEMDDFLTIPGEANAFGLQQSNLNLPEPGKRPLSSMSPTIVFAPDGAVEVVAGASGGPRIITGTLQVILNCLVFNMTADDAVRAVRLHHQWMPNAVYLEDAWDLGATESALESNGHEIRRRAEIGNVQVIRRWTDGAGVVGYQAASDPRKGGVPAGRN